MTLVERTLRIPLTAMAAAAFLACGGSGDGEPGADPDGPAPTRTSALLEPMDSFDSAGWEKADWTNGSMFNCGWKPDHVSFSDGKLVLALDDTPSYGRPYSSGEYRTRDTFGYGTFEVRMMAARGSGTVSSFFLYTGTPWDEIDVEILGKDTTKVQFNYFVGSTGGHEKVIDLGFDAAADYHTYAFEWQPDAIRWYVDGELKHEVTGTPSTLPSHAMQIMMNLWPGTGVDGWLGPFSYGGPLFARYDSVKYTPR